jgi:hypothetical protein
MLARSLAISCEARFPGGYEGIEVGEAGHLDEFLLRLPEAGDGIALPCFRLPFPS